MINFFKKGAKTYFAVESEQNLSESEVEKFKWLLDGAELLKENVIKGTFVGPRREMITPWSTNAVEITQNMGLKGIKRIEQFELILFENTCFCKNAAKGI